MHPAPERDEGEQITVVLRHVVHAGVTLMHGVTARDRKRAPDVALSHGMHDAAAPAGMCDQQGAE